MKVEQRSIDFIPTNERHGKTWNLFTIWFGANMQITPIVTGALAIVFGLNILWAVVAVVIGNLLGALFMALHSAQGPRLGIPQMIQSRAQFGVMGAVIPLIVVIFMYIGFVASTAVLGAQALSGEFPISVTSSIVILSILTFVITVFGYDTIHALQKYLSILFTLAFIAATVLVFQQSLSAPSVAVGQFSAGSFLLAVSIAATWQIAYAPYVADYSRYLPDGTSFGKTFGYSYAGTVIASTWMMILGIVLTATVPHYLDNSSAHLASYFGSLAVFMYIVIVLGAIGINVLNLYGAFMSTTTSVEAFVKIRVTRWTRFWLILLMTIISTALAVWGQGNFLQNFENFILLLEYFLIPWTAINLVDFYFIRKGNYNLNAIFDRTKEYGAFNWWTIFAYLLGVGTEIPFVNTTIFVGPAAQAMNGADISWIVGLVVSSLLYYFFMRNKALASERSPFFSE